MPRPDFLLLGQERISVHLEMPFRMERVAFQAGGIFRAMTLSTALLAPDIDILGAFRLRGIVAPTTLVDFMGVVIEFRLWEPMG